MCDRCGDDDAPAIINFAKSLLVRANDSRTLERRSGVTAVVSFVLGWLRTKSGSCKRALSENGLRKRNYRLAVTEGAFSTANRPNQCHQPNASALIVDLPCGCHLGELMDRVTRFTPGLVNA